MTTPLRIIFAGTPDFAADHLRALLGSEHEVIAVYTQPDRPAGRGKKLTPSPVKVLAEENGINVYQPASLKAQEAQETLNELNADVMVVVAYGLLLPQAVLDMPRSGCINVHGSLYVSIHRIFCLGLSLIMLSLIAWVLFYCLSPSSTLTA